MSLPEKLVDKRVLRRSLDKGTLSRADFDQYLAELPDRADNVKKTDSNEASDYGREGGGPF